MRSSWWQGFRRPVTSTTASAPRQAGAGGQAEQVDPAGRDVLTHLARPDDDALIPQRVVQLGVDEVDLAQVRLRRVTPYPGPVLHGDPRMGVALDAETLQQADRRPPRLGERVAGAGVHGLDPTVLHVDQCGRSPAARRANCVPVPRATASRQVPSTGGREPMTLEDPSGRFVHRGRGFLRARTELDAGR